MSPANNLTPTPIVDKNGKLTTVHKKSSSSPSAPSAIPSPQAVTVDESREEMIREYLSTLDGWGMSDELYESLDRALRSYPDELLDRLSDSRKKHAPGSALVAMSVGRGELANDISEQLYFFRELDDSDHYTARHLVAALHEYKQLPFSEDFSRESEKIREQCSALIQVAKSCRNLDGDIFDMNRGDYVLADDRFVDLIMENSDKAGLISSFIRVHRIIDLEVLTDLVNTESPAMGNGLL